MSPMESTWVIRQAENSCGREGVVGISRKGPRSSSRLSYSYGISGVRSLEIVVLFRMDKTLSARVTNANTGKVINANTGKPPLHSSNSDGRVVVAKSFVS